MEAVARDKEPEPVRGIEDIAMKDPDTSRWDSFCGKYEHPEEAGFIIEEVYRKDGALWAKAIDDDGDPLEFKLYPLGENEFGRKGGMLKVTFGENCCTVDDKTYEKV